MTTTTDIDAQFRLGDAVRVVERGGHALVAVHLPLVAAEIALQGAQILSWTPTGTANVFWCAPLPPVNAGKAIRGGVPVCWPWFGPHATDASQPQHGLVRTVAWTLAETALTDHGARAAFTHKSWGCALRMEFEIGARLTMTLSTANTSAVAVSITEALHTYFRVGDAKVAAVRGLDGLAYRDNTDGAREKWQVGDVPFVRETIAVFPETPDVVELIDRELGRTIRIARSGGRSTIAWHPGETAASFKDIPPGTAHEFVCVESGTVAPHAVTIAPGATHTLSVAYDVF
jgi:glucose-6-phosphate 1-epimerase